VRALLSPLLLVASGGRYPHRRLSRSREKCQRSYRAHESAGEVDLSRSYREVNMTLFMCTYIHIHTHIHTYRHPDINHPSLYSSSRSCRYWSRHTLSELCKDTDDDVRLSRFMTQPFSLYESSVPPTAADTPVDMFHSLYLQTYRHLNDLLSSALLPEMYACIADSLSPSSAARQTCLTVRYRFSSSRNSAIVRADMTPLAHTLLILATDERYIPTTETMQNVIKKGIIYFHLNTFFLFIDTLPLDCASCLRSDRFCVESTGKHSRGVYCQTRGVATGET
jgi:hypothetical protein